MATNENDSWKKRRWKIYKQVYNTNPKFRKELEELHLEINLTSPELYELLYKYKIPTECSVAIVYSIMKPDLKEQEYSALIAPPFYFWNPLAEKMGPSKIYQYTPAEHLKFLLQRADDADMSEYLGIDPKKVNYKFLAFLISNGGTAIYVSSYVKKQELHDLIDEYWDEIEPLLNENRQGFAETFYSDKLLRAVYEPKTLPHVERDELIIKLSEGGASDKTIEYELAQLGYGKVNQDNIRQIRRRYKKKK